MDRAGPPSTNLVAANNSKIKTLGRRQLQLSFAPGHSVLHSFWIAEVSQPILGAPFFRDNGLLIDLINRCLVSQRVPGLRFKAVLSHSPGVRGLRLPTSQPYEKILEDFPSLLTPQYKGEVKHNVLHYIPTTGPPLHARACRLDGEKL